MGRILYIRKRVMKKRVILIILGIIWFGSVSYGLAMLYQYENEPSIEGKVPDQWPALLPFQPSGHFYHLVMTAHPHCPCTRASVSELARIMAQTQGKLKAYVLFQKPEGFPESWVKTDLWKNTEKIPGVKVMVDAQGKQARVLGATTSGQTFLYDEHGKLMFHGGITGSRGHEGDNAGHSTVVALVHGQKSDIDDTPFFGCLLSSRLREEEPAEMMR